MYGNDSLLDLRPSPSEPEAMEFYPSIIKLAYLACDNWASDAERLNLFTLRACWPKAHTIFPLWGFQPLEDGCRLQFEVKKWYDIKSIFIQFGGIPIYCFSWEEIQQFQLSKSHSWISVFIDINETWLETWKPN